VFLIRKRHLINKHSLKEALRLFIVFGVVFSSTFAPIIVADIILPSGTPPPSLPIRTEANGGLVSGSWSQDGTLASDDTATGAQNIGFQINYFGDIRSTIFISSNGLFSTSGITTYTPYDITNPNSKPIFAPYYMDWKPNSSRRVRYGTAQVEVEDEHGVTSNRDAYVINYIAIHNYALSPTSTVQAVIIERHDTGPDNYDVEFNYGSIKFVAGSANGNLSAIVGYSSGNSDGNAYKLPQSLVRYGSSTNDANTMHPFLNNPTAGAFIAGTHPEKLISINATQAYPDATTYPNSMEGRIVFVSRDGTFQVADQNPIWFGTF